MTDNELYYWIGLRSVHGIGSVTFRRLLERFDTPERVFSAPAEEFMSVRGITPSVLDSIASGAWKGLADKEIAGLSRTDVRVATFLDDEYPKSLYVIPDPPPFLYVRGNLPRCHSIAIVGARRASVQGLKAAEKLSSGLAAYGVCVVSGLARGIDTAAHRGAVGGTGGTVAVLGCGLDIVYPPENRKLCDEIAEKGAVISEYPLGTRPLAEHFPRRNRIISGISRGVLVVEAAEKSGSLITAEYALEQGRDVYAVPGSISCPTCMGSNGLIKQGAKLVDRVEDMLEDIPGWVADEEGSRVHSSLPAFSLTPKEAFVYELLARGALHIDDIISGSELTASEVSSILLNLELKGAVDQLPGKHYSKS